MLKPVGGRGKKLPFESKTKRIPEPLEGQVDEIVNEFYRREFQVSKLPVNLEEALEVSKQVIKQKKGARDSIKALLRKIYGVKKVDI